MGCCSSKNDKKKISGRDLNALPDSVDKTRALRGDTEARVKKSLYHGNAWDQIDPLNAPYPDGQTDLNSVVNPNDMRQKEFTIRAENEMFPTRQVGEWVNVPVK